jgi:MFS family permease
LPHLPFFLASLAWNYGLGMTWLALPLYAHSQGLSNAEIGMLFSAPVLVQAPLNLAGGAHTDRIGGRRRPVTCGVGVAAAVGLLPTVAHAAPIAFWMLVVGAASAAMTLYFQITISEASRLESRSSALALGGLGGSVSHLTTPLAMGFLADRYGVVSGFYAVGVFALACAGAIALLRRWAFAAAPPSAPARP